MVKLSKQKLMELQGNLQLVANVPGTKFAYAIAKNMALVTSKNKEFEKELTPSKEFLAYDQERADLAESYALKENGVAKSEGNRWIVDPKKQKEFDAKVAELRKENLPLIDARQKQLDDFDKTLEDVVEVDLYMIPQTLLPENLTPRQMDGIMCIINEEPVKASDSIN